MNEQEFGAIIDRHFRGRQDIISMSDLELILNKDRNRNFISQFDLAKIVEFFAGFELIQLKDSKTGRMNDFLFDQRKMNRLLEAKKNSPGTASVHLWNGSPKPQFKMGNGPGGMLSPGHNV